MLEWFKLVMRYDTISRTRDFDLVGSESLELVDLAGNGHDPDRLRQLEPSAGTLGLIGQDR